MNKTKIFADGNCIVCDLEVSHYKRIAPDLFEIVDISENEFDAKKFGLNPKAVQKDMHVLTPDGDLKVGVEAFAHIWERIDRYKFASKLIKAPVILPIAKLGYEAFTWIRPYLPKRK